MAFEASENNSARTTDIFRPTTPTLGDEQESLQDTLAVIEGSLAQQGLSAEEVQELQESRAYYQGRLETTRRFIGNRSLIALNLAA